MFNGSFAKQGVMVPGTLRQHAWSDTWQDAHPIKYDGELTPEVCKAIKDAWNAYTDTIPRTSGYGKLRWSNPNTFSHVDIENRQVITNGSCQLCD